MWTIAPSVPFLETLARALLDTLPSDADPFALARMLVFVPSRRVGRGLVEALRVASGQAAILAPRIRPLGDIEEHQSLDFFLEDTLDIPPAVSTSQRRFELARLVAAWNSQRGASDTPAVCLGAADALANLLDLAAIEGGADWSHLRTIVDDAGLAAHWAQSADFLEIITQAWPARLAELGAIDPGARAAALIVRLISRWQSHPPDVPVLIAGSTGANKATRELMAMVTRLPQGAIVLPGLERDLDEGAWQEIDPSHPQAALRTTIEALGIARAQVPDLPGSPVASPLARARTALFAEALRPAASTADWRARLDARAGAPAIHPALEGLRVVVAQTPDEEAEVAALCLRIAHEEAPEARLALITPDERIAWRVCHKLARWGLDVRPGAGLPLAATPQAGVLLTLADLVAAPTDPVALAGLLNDPQAHLGAEPGSDRLARDWFERQMLRQGRIWTDWVQLSAGLDEAIFASREPLPAGLADDLGLLLARLGDALAPLQDLPDVLDLSDLAQALAQSAEAVCAGAQAGEESPLWQGPAGVALAAHVRTLIEHGAGFGPIARAQAAWFARATFSGLAVRDLPTAAPAIAILSPLEARLASFDALVLAGLDEKVWPQTPGLDPFLSRQMRVGLGLPEPEERIGLAAHDLCGWVASPQLTLVRSARRDLAPTIASRWLWRLETYLKAANLAAPAFEAGQALLEQARALDAPDGPVLPAERPCPRPPLSARPKHLRVTDFSSLIRDPYAFYGERILGLRDLDDPGADADYRDIGIAIHAALERPYADAASLLAAIDAQLEDLGMKPGPRARRQIELAQAAQAWIEWCANHPTSGLRIEHDLNGQIGSPPLPLRGKADRIEIAGSQALVLDFKTGSVPSSKQVENGLELQLPLLASLFQKAEPGIDQIGLQYWRFAASRSGPAPQKPLSDDQLLGKAWGLAHDIASTIQREEYGFAPRLRMEKQANTSRYDGVSRFAEWSRGDEEDDEVTGTGSSQGGEESDD